MADGTSGAAGGGEGRGFVIREYRPADAPAIAAALPDQENVLSARGVQHSVDSTPARAHARFWVATEGGALRGWAFAHLKWSSDPAVPHLAVMVTPDARGRGIGSALWGCAEEHALSLQPRKLNTSVNDDPHSVAFAQGRGLRPTRRSIVSTLEVSAATLPDENPPIGVDVVPLRRLADRPRDFFELYRAAEEDEPGDAPQGQYTFEEWRLDRLEHPDLDWEGSFVVADHARLVSFALVLVNRERRVAWNEMTGTLRELRGHGLATLAKSATIRWAQRNGIERMLTNNAADNAPMLAINRRLGYQPTKILTDYERRVMSTSSA